MLNRVQWFGKFLKKLRIRILNKVQNEILKPVYKKAFFNILLHRVHNLLQSFQKVQKGPQKFFLKKSNWVLKNAEFYAVYKSVKKTAKNHKKLHPKN